MSLRGKLSGVALALALVVACGRLGYEPVGAGLADGGDGDAVVTPIDGGDGDAVVAPIDASVDALPASCLIVTTATDELDGGESPQPPHLGSGLSLREAIELTDAEPGPGCVGFTAPLQLTWTSAAPAIDDQLELHGGGSVLTDASSVAFGILVGAGGGGTIVRDLAVEGYEIGFEIGAANVTIGPGVEARASNVGVRLKAAGGRITGSRIFTSNGSGIEVQAGNTTIDQTILAANDAAGINVGAGVVGLTIRHVTIDGSPVGCNLRSNPTGVVVRNAIITGAAGAAIDASGSTEVDADYVDSFGNGTPCSGCTLGPSSILTDPGYAAAAAFDFRLVAGSPAIDVGFDTGLDVNGAGPGRFDGAAPDLGAHEQ